MTLRSNSLMLLSLLVTACAAPQMKPDPGMALIISTQLKGDQLYTTGKIIAVTSGLDGKTITYPAMADRLQVVPGKYVVKYLCLVSTEGRASDIIRNRADSARVDEVTLNAGDILYVDSSFAKKRVYMPNGEYIGGILSCDHELVKYKHGENLKKDNYL